MHSTLEHVTLTGADDNTPIEGLLDLHAKFPFVEFGILVSSRPGRRMPSLEWIKRAIVLFAHQDTPEPPALSLHICGLRLKDLCAGKPILQDFRPILMCFRRWQLNFHGIRQLPGTVSRIIDALREMQVDPEIIFQLDGFNDHLVDDALALRMKFSGLFDRSHGAGRLPDRWPHGPGALFKCGWAGGLGPDNLAEQIPLIQQAAGPFPWWLDMERKVMGPGDGLDCDLARMALQACKLFIAAPAADGRAEHAPPL